jgi:hypothetical protein
MEEDDSRESAGPGYSEPPPGDEDGARRKRLEHLIRETIRRGLEKGISAGMGTISKTDTALREIVSDVKLPREVVGILFSQIDETKNALVRGVAREVRDFLEATDMAAELRKALTSLSFEIKTEIRFIPNESGGGIKPDVRAKVAPRRSRRPKRNAEAEDGSEPTEDS